MLYVIKRNHTEWVEAFSTLAEAQVRFDELKAENPEWNLQILLKKKESIKWIMQKKLQTKWKKV